MKSYLLLPSILIYATLFFASESRSQWMQLNGPYGGTVLALKATDSVMYAGTTGGLWVSADNGASWTRLSRGDTRQVGASPSGTIVAGEYPNGILRSTNGGSTWTPVFMGDPSALLHSVCFLQGDVAFAGASTGLFRSGDDGVTWTQVITGLPSGGVGALAVDSSGRLYAVSGVDIYRSTNSGLSWSQAYHDPNGRTARAFAATTQGSIFAVQYGGGVLRSTDGGNSWTVLNPGLGNTYQDVCATPSGDVFTSLYGGMLRRTTDNGTTWTSHSTTTYSHIHTLATNSSGAIFAGSGGAGIFRSTDLGTSWTSISNGIDASSISSLCVTPGGTTLVGRSGAIFRSTNNGLTWNHIDFTLVESSNRAIIRSDLGNYFFASSDGIHRSADDGLIWVRVSNSTGESYFSSLITTAEGSILAGGNRVFRSSDEGATWAIVLAISASASSFARSRSGELFAGMATGIYNSTNDGRSWQAFSDSFRTQGISSIAVHGYNTLYVGIYGQLGGIYRSMDHGVSWTLVLRDTVQFPEYLLAVNRNGDLYAVISRREVRRSTDGGSTWTYLIGEVSDRGPVCIQIAADDFAYIGTWRGGVFRSNQSTLRTPSAPIGFQPANDTVNVPLDTTVRWHEELSADTYHLQLSTDSLFTSGLVVDDSLLYVPYRDVHSLLPGTRYFWRVSARNQAGTSPFSDVWHFTTRSLPSAVVLVSPLNGALLTADSISLVWNTAFTSIMRYWVEYATDSLFLNSVIDSAVIDTQKQLYGIGSNMTFWWKVRAYNEVGWGEFSEARHFSTFSTDVDESTDVPRAFFLEQNYPNPFNSSTVISYALPRRSIVLLTIFNILGQEVTTLVHEVQAIGHYTVQWDAANVPSGIYFYRLHTDNFVKTKALALLR